MKKMMIAGMLLSVAMTAHAAGQVHIPNGFITGNMYQQFSELEQRRYVAGVFDGPLESPMPIATRSLG